MPEEKNCGTTQEATSKEAKVESLESFVIHCFCLKLKNAAFSHIILLVK
jgi:hypothetical protein